MGVYSLGMDTLDFYLDFFRSWPPEVATLLVAMIPVAELRVSIPLALEYFGLPVWSAIFWSVAGDMIPAILIILFFDQLARWFCLFSGTTKRCYEWLANRTAKKFEKGYQKYGAAVALAIFVGIPLPLTGSWSGALAAFLFGVPKRVALVSILVGVIIAAGLVTLIDLGLVRFIL